MQLSQPFDPNFLGFGLVLSLFCLSSANIARWLSRGPNSLSESRKRGRVMATAEKTEQRLAVFFICSVFGRLF